VSGVSVVAGQATLALAFGVLRWSAAMSNLVAFLVGGVVSYVLNRRWTWRRSGRSRLLREVIPFWVIASVGLVVSTIAAEVAADIGARLTPSRTAQTAIVMAATLLAYGVLWIAKFVVFDRYVWGVTPSASDRAPSTPAPPSRAPR
jgi:putative flippase GtrA